MNAEMKLKTWVTQVTDEANLTWSGPNVKAMNEQQAKQWLNDNGYKDYVVVGELISEQPQ